MAYNRAIWSFRFILIIHIYVCRTMAYFPLPSPFLYMFPPAPPASFSPGVPSPPGSLSNRWVNSWANSSTNYSVVHMGTCSTKSSANSEANSSLNSSVGYMPFLTAACSAKCSVSCAANRSASCSANCSCPDFGDCMVPPPYASSSVQIFVPSHWVWLYFFTTFSNCLTLACYGVFSFLIAFDVFQAIKKRATWLPAKAFSLSGVTVQIIVWWTSVSSINNKCKKEVGVNESVVLHQLVLSGKVAVCVFIGYLLPGMAASSVTTFLALGLSICVQITSELLIFQKHQIDIPKELQRHDAIPKHYNGWITWANVANSVLLLCFILLGLILVCTILASQTIHDLLKQRTSAIFSSTKEDGSVPISWNDFDDEVLSSWLVARVCRPDYVISRSVFSSAVGVVITLCVIISLLSNTSHNIYFSHRPLAPQDFGIFSLLFSFIIIGWIVTCWRWFAAQLYFRSHRQSWERCLSMEDFWTRNTVELIHMYDLKRDRQQFFKAQNSTPSMLSKLQRFPTNIFTKVKLHKFVHLGLMLQLSVVFFSKLCGLLSEVIIGNFVYCCRKHMRNGHQVELPKSYKRILELVCMPGEDPIDLWDANEMAFNKAKALMQKDCKKGKSCEKIISSFSRYSQERVEKGEKLLNELQKLALPLVSEHFPSIEKQCVRITAVSLIKIFIELYKPMTKDMKSVDPVKKVMKAFDEVWDLLRFVDECDIDLQANEISILYDLQKDKDQVGMAAETEFYKLEMEYKKTPTCEDCATDVKAARSILKDLLMDSKKFLRRASLVESDRKKIVANLSDSKDWMQIAPKYHLYKLCKFMLDNSDEDCGSHKNEDSGGDEVKASIGDNNTEGSPAKAIKDFKDWTENALGYIIAYCMARLPDMLVNQCWKWAQEFEEDKLWEAIDLAGKCRGIMEVWEPNPKLTRNSIKQEILAQA